MKKTDEEAAALKKAHEEKVAQKAVRRKIQVRGSRHGKDWTGVRVVAPQNCCALLCLGVFVWRRALRLQSFFLEIDLSTFFC